jgi:hypothetical protein
MRNRGTTLGVDKGGFVHEFIGLVTFQRPAVRRSRPLRQSRPQRFERGGAAIMRGLARIGPARSVLGR